MRHALTILALILFAGCASSPATFFDRVSVRGDFTGSLVLVVDEEDVAAVDAGVTVVGQAEGLDPAWGTCQKIVIRHVQSGARLVLLTEEQGTAECQALAGSRLYIPPPSEALEAQAVE